MIAPCPSHAPVPHISHIKPPSHHETAPKTPETVAPLPVQVSSCLCWPIPKPKPVPDQPAVQNRCFEAVGS